MGVANVDRRRITMDAEINERRKNREQQDTDTAVCVCNVCVVGYVIHPLFSWTNKVIVIITSAGAPRLLHTDIRLPLRLVVKPCFPVKNANFRLTIDANKPPVNLNDLFPGQ